MDNSSHLMTNFQTLTWSHFLVFMTKKIRPRNNKTHSTKTSYLVFVKTWLVELLLVFCAMDPAMAQKLVKQLVSNHLWWCPKMFMAFAVESRYFCSPGWSQAAFQLRRTDCKKSAWDLQLTLLNQNFGIKFNMEVEEWKQTESLQD